MGSFSLVTAKEIAPAAIFSDMPPSFRSYLNRGFSQLAQVDDKKIEVLTDLLASGIDLTDDSRLNEMSRILGIASHDAKTLSAALSLLIAFVTGREDFDEVITAGRDADAIAPTNVNRIREIGQRLSKGKAALKQMVETSSLASEVAPSFLRLEVTTDLRFKFDDDSKVLTSVPVAICYLSTDSRTNQCFFQMKKSDVTQMIGELQKLELQLNLIEQWSKEHR
jgi:hypothetical protein